MDINFYDEMFSGLTNPKHQSQVRDFLVSICNGAVETLVKTSHQVLTTPNSDPDPSSISCPVVVHSIDPPSSIREENVTPNGNQNSGWVSTVSFTLAVPRRFVFDVTGRVTFERIRSLVDFFLWMVSVGLKRIVNAAPGRVVERGREVIRYVGARPSIIDIIFLALYLHIMGDTRFSLPA
ncbi:Protein PHLOEM PROTEIN 2-LIKE like [Actinidia chinensis var. chinensis]|uniref:Protein PHLOEM PROTEIN 2-LIKE like n=1 Tax=Actinidia chinensis var. chinensis TaxID=1590841 RepID=A0A2R6Q0K2_ACTCC|nr:Protein PHLOEM PROTEIN 2-LIKE like [Actinidia chinensis var. chinensis]